MKKENATPETQGSANDTATSIARNPTKKELCLSLLLERGTRGVNKLEALQAYGETCLNTTISELGREYGLSITRVSEPHIHRHGGTTHFNRYWLADAKEEQRAMAILRTIRDKRHNKPHAA